MKKTDKFIFGTIVGGAIGSVLGLLFAPKSGKETRQDVAEASKKAYRWGKKQAHRFQREHKDEIDDAMTALNHSARRIKASFRALRKQAVDPALHRLAKSREEEESR